LVSYYKQLYGPDFFVKLNCSYYLPGLPVSVIQLHADERADMRFGSHRYPGSSRVTTVRHG
jgi:hypothetical protein